MCEIWKEIKGYEGIYWVSNKGVVKNKHGRILKTFITHGGYKCIGLHLNGKRKKKRVHRLVAKAFVIKVNGKETVNHIDGNPVNNDFNNLEWVNTRENVCHSMRFKKNNYTGVVKRKGIWGARIHIKGNVLQLGFFETEVEAALAYKKFFLENNITNKYAKLI